MLILIYRFISVGFFILLSLFIAFFSDALSGELHDFSKMKAIKSSHLPPALDDLIQRDLGLHYQIGMKYYYGHGVEKNRQIAMEWLKIAAENGYAQAQFQMGLDKAGNASEQKDLSESIMWFRKAAEQNDSDAQTALGLALYEGRGVTRDKTEAVKWLSEAAYAGQKTARQFLDQKNILVPRCFVWVARGCCLPARWGRMSLL